MIRDTPHPIVTASGSVDPAIGSHTSPDGTLPLSELRINEDGVYLFDFDGVIASRDDDDIYRLAPTSNEISLLAEVAACFGIRCQGMEQRYQRHLLYQAAAWRLRLPIQPGPAFSQAVDSGQRARLFVLTARSGWYAVERLRLFLSSANILPVEIFNVGRIRKDRQLQLICDEFQSRPIFFIDDSAAHLADAASIAAGNLQRVHVDSNLQPERDEIVLRRHFVETIHSALSTFGSETACEQEGTQDQSRD